VGNILVFFISFFQIEMMLEVLKLFVVLSTFLTREMIQRSQYAIAILHPLFNGGLLLLGNAFESSIDNNPAALVLYFDTVVSIWLQWMAWNFKPLLYWHALHRVCVDAKRLRTKKQQGQFKKGDSTFLEHQYHLCLQYCRVPFVDTRERTRRNLSRATIPNIDPIVP
jgi:hypothetical protein